MSGMDATRERLRRGMDAAVAAMDFEEAARLRDQLSLLSAAPEDAVVAELDTSRMTRQRPGHMGLGTGEPTVKPPPGWTPPKRPDPMPTGVRTRRTKRR